MHQPRAGVVVDRDDGRLLQRRLRRQKALHLAARLESVISVTRDPGRIACHNGIGWHIACDNCPCTDHGMATDLNTG